MVDAGLGFMASLVIAGLAYQQHKLDRYGALLAVVMGTVIVITGGWLFAAMMIWFFISSGIVGHWAKDSKPMRTWQQVFASGAIPTVISMWYWFDPDVTVGLVYASAIAIATADTWSSELGRLSKKQPVHLTKRILVPIGTDGAISALGTLAGALGAISVSLFVGGSFVVIASGLIGNLIDSLLGTVQEKIKFLSNTGVNFYSQLLTVGLLILWYIGPW
jgi:uncharacterized protein (TIGR00297 family)